MTALRAALWVLVTAKIVGGWGLTWDIQWHVTIGRDSFWIAPHVMMYAAVATAAVIGFGVLGLETFTSSLQSPHAVRFLGLRGTPGFHLAAWGVALVLLAAPVDDLWHRLFGLDVTLWSPPHLLGLFGSKINTVGCLVIACEVYARGSRTRLVAVTLIGAMLLNSLRVVLDPAYLLAYASGGVLFYAPVILGALFLPLALIATSDLTGRRLIPIVLVVVMIGMTLAAERVASVGFAIVKPVSVIGEEIQKDPTSAIALANAIAQKNRHTAPPLVVRLFALFPVALMVLVDQRRRPIAATVAYAIGLFALNAWNLGRSPAFEPMAPGIALTIVALAITTAAALAGGVAARWFADRLMRLRPEAWTEAGPTAMPATAAPGPTASRTPARTTS